MRKNKLLLLLALLLTAATGAWADETPLLTIESTGYTDFLSGSKTFDDKVTVTFSNPVYYDGEEGWYADGTASLLTVAGINGYTITSCKFYTNGGDAQTGYTVEGESPSVYLSASTEVYTDANQSVYLGYQGVKKIEVFGAAAATGYTVSMKDGVKDADKWTVKVDDGQAQALPIGGLKGDGKETVTLQYNGRLKVKGVKATSEAAAKPAATVTTVPQAKTDVEAGSTTALIEAGVADGGTLMYAVTTTNTKPTSTDGFSASVPTAETITASGTVYVWYYVKANDTHSDSEIAGPVSVTVAEATPALSITNPTVGQVIGSDGKNYAAASVPSGVTKVAMIAYVSGSHGLAIALADEGSMNWATAKSTCEAKTPAFTGGTWKLPTQAEWNQMFSANGGNAESYNGLNAAINTAGGTTLQSGFYWSSSEYSPGVGAHLVHLDDGDADWSKANETLVRKVRACLAFTVEQAAKTPATVTTAPTGAAIVGVGKNTALVSGGAADGGTLWYAVTTTNTKPTSTAGFSDAVPTAQTITASGKVYVWYYVKGDDTHSDSEIAATAIEVTVMAVPITVTWNPSDIVPKSLSDKSFTKDGITFTAATCDFQVLTFGGGGTFTTTLGNFTKIEISADFTGNVSGTGWTNDGWQSATWTGNAASVSFSGDIWGGGMTCEGGNLKIVFTIE